MKNKRVIIIAMDQPLDSDAHFKGKMANAENRAERQASRFPDLDLLELQKGVHGHLKKLALSLDGRYMGLLDLMNTLKNGRRFPRLTPENASQYLLFANEFTLNGVYLYQVLRGAGYDPLVVQNFSLVSLPDLLKDKPPLAVCISSTFLYFEDIMEMARQIKALDPSVPVIVGGILAKKILHRGENLQPQTLKWLETFYGKVDIFVIETNGEMTLKKVLKALSEGKDPGGLPNLGLFDSQGRIFFTPRLEEKIDMDRTAIDWEGIPREYLRRTLSVATSRGCYYRCRFCTYHRWFPKVIYKSLEVLQEELRSIQRLSFVKHVRFADDNFTAKKERLKAVLEMMIRENFDFSWSSYARASALTPDLFKLMKASKCDLLVMGIESGSSDILKNMDKKLDPAQALNAVRMHREHGIDSQGAFVIGYPGETAETFQATIDLINESGLNYYHPYLFYSSKDMLVHEDREKFGLKGLGLAWRHNTMDSVEAARLMSCMVSLIESGFTDGQQNTWETYKILRGEGYSQSDIAKLHRLKRELQLGIQNSGDDGTLPIRGEAILKEMEAVMGRI
jgi:p-methyltransferase